MCVCVSVCMCVCVLLACSIQVFLTASDIIFLYNGVGELT